MVVFTCGHCGKSVKKPKIEKHYLTKCKNHSPSLSCMDCSKEFLGNDYESHTQCISKEDYSGKGFQAKENKRGKKQNVTVEFLQSVLDEHKDASENVLRIIKSINTTHFYKCTPKKKPKFINFVKHTCGDETNPKDIDQVWDLISVKLTTLTNDNREKQIGTNDSVATENENKRKEKLTKTQRKKEKKKEQYEAELQSPATPKQKRVAGENRAEEKVNNEEVTEQPEVIKSKNKKRKRQTTATTMETNGKIANTESEPIKPKKAKRNIKTDDKDKPDESICLHDQTVAHKEVDEKNGKFNWHSVIISVLQKKGNDLPLQRLKKKVLLKYSEYTGNEVDDRIADKFIKKLKSVPNVSVDKNMVLLLED